MSTKWDTLQLMARFRLKVSSVPDMLIRSVVRGQNAVFPSIKSCSLQREVSVKAPKLVKVHLKCQREDIVPNTTNFSPPMMYTDGASDANGKSRRRASVLDSTAAISAEGRYVFQRQSPSCNSRFLRHPTTVGAMMVAREEIGAER